MLLLARFLALPIAAALFFPTFMANANPCSDRFRSVAENLIVAQNCWRKTLGAELAWSFNDKTRQLKIAFGSRLDSDSGWLAWGLNPTARRMVGTQALIGIKLQNCTLVYHLYNITADTRRGCQLLPADDAVSKNLGVREFNFTYNEYLQYYLIQATIVLPSKYNASRTNFVWQIGYAAAGEAPQMHPSSLKHLSAVETVDFVARTVVSESAHLRRVLITAHGILNMGGWGTLLPIGAIISRYFKKYPFKNRQWLRFHFACQFCGYIVGSTGWGVGLWLGRTSKYYSFPAHRILGIIIFIFTSIQMLALPLRPAEKESFRPYWNMYHHFLGYSLLVLISVNIFIGIGILEEVQAWKWGYIGVLGALGVAVVGLEGYTWTKFYMDRYSS